MKNKIVSFFLLLTFPILAETTVTISNLRPRMATDGSIVDAHDGEVVKFGETFYLYGTAYENTSGFQRSNYYQCYSSTDLQAWKREGVLLRNPPSGIYYRPHVLYNIKTRKYVLWYNWSPELGNGKFGVAVSDKPTGPFQIVNTDVQLFYSKEGVSDFGLFMDDDNTAYILYNTVNEHQGSIEKLSPDFLSSTKENGGYLTQGCAAGAMFKRKGKYYLLTDETCCFCTQGSGANVYISDRPMEGYVLRNNINRYPGIPAPVLVDGVLNPNMYTELRKKADGDFCSMQLEFVNDSLINCIKVVQFTGNRKGTCGDTLSMRTQDPIVIPTLEVSVNKEGEWIPVEVKNTAMTSSVYTIITLHFNPVVTQKVRIRPVQTYPYSLHVNEVEVYYKGVLLSGGALAFVDQVDAGKALPVVPGQQTCVMPLETTQGDCYIWMADLWGSASDNIKGHDYQYWSAPLRFTSSGDIEPLEWSDKWTVTLK
jgi:hypothetical protein